MTSDKIFNNYGVRCTSCNRIRHANVHLFTTIDIDGVTANHVNIDYPRLAPDYKLDAFDHTIHVICPECGAKMEWIEPKLYPMFKALYELGFTVVNISDGVAKAGHKVHLPSMSFFSPIPIDPQLFIDVDKEGEYKIDIEPTSLGKSKNWITNQIVKACFREDQAKMNILSIMPRINGCYTKLSKSAKNEDVSMQAIINDIMLMRIMNMAILGYAKASGINLPEYIQDMIAQNKFINLSLEGIILDHFKN